MDDEFTPPRWIELLRLINVFAQECEAREEEKSMATYRKIKTEMKRIEKKEANEL